MQADAPGLALTDEELERRKADFEYLERMCVVKNERHPVFLRPDNNSYDFNGDAEWIVEKIVARPKSMDGVKKYKVRYRGFGKGEDDWQPALSLKDSAPSALQKYKERQKQAKQ